MGYGEDIAKGVAGGLGRGVAGTLGIGGTAGSLLRYGLGKAGVPEEYLDKGAAIARQVGRVVPAAAMLTGPSGADLRQQAEQYTGKFYEPQTMPGQYASTLAEFAPGAILGGGGVGARIFNTVAPAVTSESAGQLTKGTAAEPYARFLGGVLGAPLAGKIVTPAAPASAARQAAVSTLEGEGIPLTAGERTGSRPIQWLESSAADTPGSAGRAQTMKAAQKQAYDQTITEGAFDRNALHAQGVDNSLNLPDPSVFTAGKQSLKNEYQRLTPNELVSDPQLHNDLWAHRTQYERAVAPSQRTGDIEHFHNDIVDALTQGGGKMPGDVYQSYRSILGDLSDSAGGAAGTNAYKGMQASLDAAMQRNLSPADAAAWKLNNQRYAIMKTIAPQVAKSTENLSPQGIAQSLRTGRPEQYAAQSGALDKVANAADLVLKPMPNSGTSARLGWQQLFNLPTMLTAGAGGGYMGGGLTGAVAGTATAAAPFVIPRLALSRPGQAYLGNQLLPNNTRAAIAQALMQQAISQRGACVMCPRDTVVASTMCPPAPMALKIRRSTARATTPLSTTLRKISTTRARSWPAALVRPTPPRPWWRWVPRRRCRSSPITTATR